MRTCQSCGKQNDPERDFCDCGEYLRWEPTGFVDAITPEMAAAAAAEAPPAAAAPAAAPPQGQPGAAPPPDAAPPPAAPAAPPPAAAAPPPPAAPPNGAQPPVVRTQVQGAVAPPPAAVPPEAAPAEEVETATITLRLPDEDADKTEMLAVGVHPGGERVRVKALIRNQSGIVDNYQVRVEGLPEEWYSVLPDTVYLVPYGSGGTYEQEIEIHLHPPRSPEAEARLWELEVVAHSKAQERTAATAPLAMAIQPFEQHDTKVKPERASGRRRANFKVTVRNKANAPVFVAFDANEADNECGFKFDPPTAEVAPGEAVTTNMRVKPPKQIWIGRPHERRIDVATKTGDEAAALAAAADEADADEAEGEGGGVRGKLKGKKVPGMYGPQVYKPQVYKPNIHLGPGGLQMSKPMVRGPQVRGPQAKGMNLNLNNLKMPGSGAPPPITGPLLPTQAVFRQKPWLPWWVAIVIPLLLLLALLLFLFLPKNVEVPNVVGKPSTFEAEKLITEAKLKLDPQVKEKVDTKSEPGTILSQTPKAGESAEEGAAVTLLVAIGDGNVTVPDLEGMTPGDAEKALREKNLSLGQVTPQPVDPKGTIKSQIPAPKEVVKEGKPVDVFLVVPKPGGGVKPAVDGPGEAPGGSGGDGGDEGGEAGPVKVPEIDGADQQAYTQKVADAGLAPKVKREFNEDLKKGAIIRVDPKPGTEVDPAADVTVIVSAGFPQIAFDNDRDVLLVSGAKGQRKPAIAKSEQQEKDPAWSFDGSRIAYTSEGQVFLRNLLDKDATPQALTKEGEIFSDLAWAPTTDVNTIAMIKTAPGATGLADTKTSLCFGAIRREGFDGNCKDTSENVLGRKINWSSDGKELLVFGANPVTSELGMIRYRSEKAFSANPADWESKGFVTDVSKPGQGAIDAAFSLDGEQLAVVVLDGDGTTNLFMTKPDDPLLQNPLAKPLGVRACKVIWRPDGRQLVVIRNDDCLGSDTGELLRVSVDNPKDDQQSLNLTGDNATFQPLSAE